MCRFLLVLNLQFFLVFMPVSPCSCASFSSPLCHCLLVLEWASPCSCASFSSSFASFFLSLQGFPLFPVSHCPPAGFSLSLGLISSCPHVGFSLSLCFSLFMCQFLLILCQLLPILTRVPSVYGFSLSSCRFLPVPEYYFFLYSCRFLLVFVPMYSHPYSGFFSFRFLLVAVSPIVPVVSSCASFSPPPL